MKRLLLVLIAISIMGCEKEEKIDYALVSGKIENSKAQKALIETVGFKSEISISVDGVFSDTLRIPENGFYNLNIGREFTPMFIAQGDSIHISIDAKKFDESITYTGTGAAENNYLAQKMLDDASVKANSAEFYSLNESEFKSKVSEITEKNQTSLEALVEADKDFLITEKQNLVYDEYALLQSYKQSRSYFTKNQGFEVSDTFIPEELKNMVYDDPKAYKSSISYKQMALRNTMNSMFETIGNDITTVSTEDLGAINDIKIPALKNEVVSYLSGFLISPSNENMKDIYELFIANTSDDDVKKGITDTFEKNKNLMKGMPSPKFVDYENHKGGETSLDDLKGSYVYIDVWATWCGPCIREIPSLKEVEKKFHGQNIEFVSTSIDQAKDYEKWKTMVDEKELGGSQLFADNDWQSKFVQDYAIQGIPRFILIDPDGKIVSADAPRPSDPKLTAMLESELNSQETNSKM
ncbi:MAG: TlpA disulfide reductase family protein, partial [Bacteroidota bacterium]